LLLGNQFILAYLYLVYAMMVINLFLIGYLVKIFLIIQKNQVFF